MSSVIECCVRNVAEEDLRRLEAENETVRVRPCLERCGTCRDEPFLVVDGDPVTGPAVERRLGDPEVDPE